jgi:NADPH:quinone reductase-like Zn-dependent oxidoreductase
MSRMPRAVTFSRYGGPEVLDVVDVPRPAPGPGQVLVRAVVASTNPGEIAIREGAFAAVWPAHFPEGQGNDFAGLVAGIGAGVAGFSPGDEVMGFAPRAAQADYVVVEAGQLAVKPCDVPWESAAVLPGVGSTAWATVRAVEPRAGETVVVSAAAGGVGVLAAQLALLGGARVLGTTSERNFEFLRSLGVVPVHYGPGLADRLRDAAPEGIDAYLDNFGDGNVATAVELGVAPGRINTIADGAAARRHGVRTDAQEQASSPALWRDLATLILEKELTVPIHAVYELDDVRQAYEELAKRHTRGKIVLRVSDGKRP